MAVIKRELFNSSIPIDGRYANETQDERDKRVKVIYENTNRLLVSGALIPVKEGHNDPIESLRGHLESIDLKHINNYYSIIGTMIIDDEWDISGLPSQSIEKPPYGYLNGELFGDYISAIALQGTTPSAFPLLETFSANNYETKEFMKMMDKKPFIDAVLAKLPALLEGIWNEMYPVDTETETQISQMQSQLNDMKMEAANNEFASLLANRKIDETKKEIFMNLAMEKGLSFASQALSYQLPQVPAGEIVGENKTTNTHDKQIGGWVLPKSLFKEGKK